METVHVEEISETKRARWVYDPIYETRGSYALDTEEETKAAEDWELERLNDGRLVALGCIIEERCDACGEWKETDSLWGIVIRPEEHELDAHRKHCM